MVLVSGHSPWGQYQVYRQKHLLIMSTISDEPTYSFSRRLVTALNEVSDYERAVDCGTDEFITKPVNKLELLTRVRTLLELTMVKQGFKSE